MADDLVEIGFIRAAHGLRGQVVVHAHSGSAESLTAYGALLNADGSKTFTLTVKNASGTDFLCAVDGITDRNAAEALRGTKLFVRADALPPPPPDEFYIRDLIGLSVRDENGTELGRVANVIEIGSNSAFDIAFTHNGTAPLPAPQTELLLYTKQNVPHIDMVGRVMTVNLPFGLLETPEKMHDTND